MNEKIIREKTVCFTGHRSEKLPGGEGLELLRKRLALEIERALQDGYDTFLFGGAYGFDLMAAEEVLKKKALIDLQNPRYIRLIAVIPFEEQAVRFSLADHERYYEIMPQCNEVITLNTYYSSQCYRGQGKAGKSPPHTRPGNSPPPFGRPPCGRRSKQR